MENFLSRLLLRQGRILWVSFLLRLTLIFDSLVRVKSQVRSSFPNWHGLSSFICGDCCLLIIWYRVIGLKSSCLQSTCLSYMSMVCTSCVLLSFHIP